MPFDSGLHAFTTEAVEGNAPARSGIYGIYNFHYWLFIGEADDIRATLLAHLTESRAFLMAQHPKGFAYELCSPADRCQRQDYLILELEPLLNRRIPYQGH
jgi:hypothetical protein